MKDIYDEYHALLMEYNELVSICRLIRYHSSNSDRILVAAALNEMERILEKQEKQRLSSTQFPKQKEKK